MKEKENIAGDRVKVTMRGHVADVRLARPEKLNALDVAMFQRISDVAAELADDRSVRAVVLSGEGKAFCAGIDLECLSSLNRPEGHAALLARTHGSSNLFQNAALAWRQLDVPVIAALHGNVFGGGFQLGLAADIRVADPASRFSIMETRWGIVPDMGGTLLMRAYAREDVIRELTYTGKTFTAPEALAFGFVTQVAEEPIAVALALAEDIAGRSPDAIRAAKRLFNASLPLEPAALARESAEQILLFQGHNHREAVSANLERRSPDFR